MKTRLFIRVAKNGYKLKVDASTKSHEDPLFSVGYRNERTYLPTVGFAVDFNIPDELLSKASVVIAEINVATKDAKILTGVPVPEKKK